MVNSLGKTIHIFTYKKALPEVSQVNLQDVPSGFALRQFILFYLMLWIVNQPYRELFNKRAIRGNFLKEIFHLAVDDQN